MTAAVIRFTGATPARHGLTIFRRPDPAAGLPPPLAGLLTDWCTAAQPGDRVVYARGFLAQLRGAAGARLRDGDLDMLCAGAAAADLERQGRVVLLQRRIAENDYAYIAIKVRRP
ncbi:MAG: hypothetical protein ACOYOH_28955 [Paracraurococcus sp.]